jgi:hypothetical protein
MKRQQSYLKRGGAEGRKCVGYGYSTSSKPVAASIYSAFCSSDQLKFLGHKNGEHNGATRYIALEILSVLT